ncbi:30517_t:CDS:2 [Racocetra persica]|uniref:30517_t:CDS:1 n=1 Tax=Racocetra persica TaxID=160502 RepID=A0ACA9KCD3_9GLOM|nr:30517_t:CDS:2 [Racocetra persica]
MSLKNYKKVHKNCYRIEDKSNNSTDTYNSEEINTYDSDEFDIINRQSSHYIESETDNNTSTFNFDKLDVISRQNNNIMIDDQESINKSNLIFEAQSIAGDLISDNQEISNIYKFGKIFGKDILENNMVIDEANEFQSDDNEYSNDSKIDNTDFQGHQERLFSEFYNFKWWGYAQQHILSKISLDNILTNLRNKAETKALVGIILTLQGTKKKQKPPEFRQLI